MSRSDSAELIAPRYVGRFACIAGDCEDTCCSGWQIDLDADTVRVYQTVQDPVLRPLLKEHLRVAPLVGNPARAGTMGRVGGDCWDCAMLTPDKLCLIQTRLGHSALSDTCASFPRETAELGGLTQMVLSLSCPEAARLALLVEDAFELEVQIQPLRAGELRRPLAPKGLNPEMMNEVRIALVQILQTRELELAVRLRVIGLLCERLTGFMASGQFSEIPKLIGGIDLALNQGLIERGEGPFKTRPEVQVQLVTQILKIRRVERLSEYEQRVMDEVLAGLGLSEAGTRDPEDLARRFADGSLRLARALEPVPWLLEHYLLNDALAGMMPWGGRSPMGQFALFVLRLAILKVMLTGRAAAQAEPLTPRALAETVQVFSRRYHHSESFRSQMDRILQEAGWVRLEQLFLLI